MCISAYRVGLRVNLHFGLSSCLLPACTAVITENPTFELVADCLARVLLQSGNSRLAKEEGFRARRKKAPIKGLSTSSPPSAKEASRHWLPVMLLAL